MTEQRASRPVGRPPLTDRRALLSAAREIGFSKLTVGAVTEAVGVKYSTFYRHYPSLEALVAELVDEVYAEAELPAPSGPWQTYLTEACTALFALLDRNPGLAETIIRLPTPGNGALSAYRDMSDVLLAAGFTAEQAAVGSVSTLELVVVTWLTGRGDGHSPERHVEQAAAAQRPVDPDVRAATARLVGQPSWGWAARKIALLIKGLEAELAGR